MMIKHRLVTDIHTDRQTDRHVVIVHTTLTASRRQNHNLERHKPTTNLTKELQEDNKLYTKL